MSKHDIMLLFLNIYLSKQLFVEYYSNAYVFATNFIKKFTPNFL